MTSSRPPKIIKTDIEGNLKKNIVKFLKSKGCKVRINKQDATTSAAFPDLTFFLEGFYGMIETKAHKNSPWRPGQKEAIEFWDNWSWARGVYLENWEEVKKELEEILK